MVVHHTADSNTLVGSETFRFSSEPSYVADRLERWFRYLFNDFLPGAGQVINWKSPDLGAKLRPSTTIAVNSLDVLRT